MLHYLKGSLTMTFEGGLVVEAAGVGYMVYVPENSILYQKIGCDDVLVYTVMILREDDVSLYGFADKESLEMFQKLKTVNGVGAKAALAVLSAMPLDQVQKAIIFEDPDTLTRANGIGKKTAQRIVLELKEKVGTIGGLPEQAGTESAGPSSNTKKEEAADALVSLGYSRSEAMTALLGIDAEGLSAEEYIKKALRGISTR
ncbi:MAG: Holliday junction branch migration protein RuvA [Eubacteriales bacterium]|nr:Holliday junction branch migration protein RuvA [Eubacteriales bacterium]MDD3349310.1 Holliday junction branch migration protein RuvA [Eubacteriales bacterium]